MQHGAAVHVLQRQRRLRQIRHQLRLGQWCGSPLERRRQVAALAELGHDAQLALVQEVINVAAVIGELLGL